MQIQSKVERDFWTRQGLAIVPDILIGVGISFATSFNPVITVLATVISLQILYLTTLIKDIAWDWLAYRLSGDRSKLRQAALDFLRENKFPEPDEYLRDVDSYFTSVMDDARLSYSLRIKAALALNTANCMASFRGKLRFVMAYEDAIEKYKRTFPAEGVGPEMLSQMDALRSDEAVVRMRRRDLEDIAWLADYGLDVWTVPRDNIFRSSDRLKKERAEQMSSTLDAFERNVALLFTETEEEKDRRFYNYEDRMKRIWEYYS